ncbi:hypothetical protein [Curvivirga sp.]|uniref:hypothetical protein n=1 Tax=Curvivirga sp. TaxID=2856848 RepID=UPI003B5A7978
MSDTPILRYSKQGLMWDGAKGALGLFLVVLPLVMGQPVTWLSWILYGLAAIFIVFLGRIYIRAVTEITHDHEKLKQLKPISKTLEWDKLNKLKLRYYSTKKSGENGWMFLQLKAENISINLDSQLEDFDEILHRASEAAARKELSLDPVTLDNLNASGINTPMDRVDL